MLANTYTIPVVNALPSHQNNNVQIDLKEWNMVKIFSCHLIRICFRSDKHPHLDWSI